MEYYKKVGRKYVKVHETPRFLMDGIWLVKNDCHGMSHIMNIGELPTVYPYAQMSVDLDDLARYLYLDRCLLVDSQVQKVGNSYYYTLGSNLDNAKTILKFLSLSIEDRKKKLAELQEQCNKIDDFDKCFRLNYRFRSNVTKADIEKAIIEREKEIERLKKLL